MTTSEDWYAAKLSGPNRTPLEKLLLELLTRIECLEQDNTLLKLQSDRYDAEIKKLKLKVNELDNRTVGQVK